MNPLARKSEIYVEHLPNEVVLYNKTNHQAHCLNMTVFAVWENADGTKTVDEIADIIEQRFKISSSRELVLLALTELEKADLLENTATVTAEALTPSRRDVARKLALAGVSASLLPFVASIMAPTPAMARSYTAQNYASELVAVTQDIAKNPIAVLKNKGTVQNDLAAGTSDGNAGIVALAKGNVGAAQTDFQNAESEFDDLLKALGLPPF